LAVDIVRVASGSLYDADVPAFLKRELLLFGVDKYW
jgi:hypothetical protein